MNIQPYFPEPDVVPGNAAAESYGARLRFIRQVIGLHFLTVASIGVVAYKTPSDLNSRPALWGALACLLALTLVRRLAPHSKWDFAASFVLLFPLLASLGVLVRSGIEFGLPLWSMGIGAVCALLYATLCGRDFSFLGQFTIAGAATIVANIVLASLGHLGTTGALAACTIALSYLAYFVYDLAALLTRRRLGEVLPATADLYRDVLNFTTYSFRVVQHLRKFRI